MAEVIPAVQEPLDERADPLKAEPSEAFGEEMCHDRRAAGQSFESGPGGCTRWM